MNPKKLVICKDAELQRYANHRMGNSCTNCCRTSQWGNLTWRLPAACTVTWRC